MFQPNLMMLYVNCMIVVVTTIIGVVCCILVIVICIPNVDASCGHLHALQVTPAYCLYSHLMLAGLGPSRKYVPNPSRLVLSKLSPIQLNFQYHMGPACCLAKHILRIIKCKQDKTD